MFGVKEALGCRCCCRADMHHCRWVPCHMTCRQFPPSDDLRALHKRWVSPWRNFALYFFLTALQKGCHSCKNLSWDLILTFCRRQVLENIRNFTSGLDSQNRNDPKIEFQGMILIYSLIFEPLSMFQLPKIGQSNNQRPDSFVLYFPFGQVYTPKVYKYSLVLIKPFWPSPTFPLI